MRFPSCRRIGATLVAAAVVLVPATAAVAGGSTVGPTIQDLKIDTARPTYLEPNFEAPANTFGSFMPGSRQVVESFAAQQVGYRNPVMVKTSAITASISHAATTQAPYWTAQFAVRRGLNLTVNTCTIDPTWESRSRPGIVTVTKTGTILISCTWAANRHLGGFFVNAIDAHAPKTSRGLAIAKVKNLGFKTTARSFQYLTPDMINLRAQVNPDAGNVLTPSGNRLFGITAKTIIDANGEPIDIATADASIKVTNRPSATCRFTQITVTMTNRLIKAPFVLVHTQVAGLDLYTHGSVKRTATGGYEVTSTVPVGTRLVSLDVFGVLPGLKVISPVTPLPMDGVRLS